MQTDGIYCTPNFICFLNIYIVLNYVSGSVVFSYQQLSVYFNNGVNKIVRKTIDGCIIGKLITIIPAQSFISANPNKTLTVLVNATNRVGHQPIMHRVGFKKYRLPIQAKKSFAKKQDQ